MKGGCWRRFRRAAPVMIFCLVVGWAFAITTTADPQYVSEDVCADCHADISEAFHNTPHGVYLSGNAEYSTKSCQSCHGPGGKHVDSEDPADIINPMTVDFIEGEATCLDCHKGNAFEGWAMSNHRSGDVRCANCHQMHVTQGEENEVRHSDKCLGCHTNVRAAGFMPSHHPIAEGKMECTDCHDPHGGAGEFVQDGSIRERCFTCHAGVEGPFVFEHAPVAEDCMICHTPHGSVANNLLKVSEPALCLNCHSMHFHAGVEGVDGPFTPPQATDRSGVSTPDAWKRVMLTKCTQCHTEIHGSDLPSQSISGQGRALTR